MRIAYGDKSLQISSAEQAVYYRIIRELPKVLASIGGVYARSLEHLPVELMLLARAAKYHRLKVLQQVDWVRHSPQPSQLIASADLVLKAIGVPTGDDGCSLHAPRLRTVRLALSAVLESGEVAHRDYFFYAN